MDANPWRKPPRHSNITRQLELAAVAELAAAHRYHMNADMIERHGQSEIQLAFDGHRVH